MQSVIPSLRLFKPTDDIYDVCQSPIFNLMWWSMIMMWKEPLQLMKHGDSSDSGDTCDSVYSGVTSDTNDITTVVIVVTVETLVVVLSNSRDISDKSDIVNTRDSKNRGDTSDNRHISERHWQ